VPGARELDTATVVRSRLYTDWRESLFSEAGDFLIARDEGALGKDHLAGEIGEVLTGAVPGRRTAEELTLFESLGIGIEDLAAAQYILGKAEAAGTGVTLEMGGLRDR
jgi:ornithine cyclodeaminase